MNRLFKIEFLQIPKFSKEEEKKFNFYYNKGAVRLYRFTVIVIFAATVPYFYLDYLSAPSLYEKFWLIRLVALFFIGIGYWLSFKPKGLKYLQVIANWTSIIYSLAVIFMIYLSRPGDLSYTSYYQGINIMLIASMPLRVRLKYFLRNATLVISIYLFVAIYKQHLADMENIKYLINNLFFILTTVLGIGLGDFLLDIYLKNIYLQEKLLKEQNAEIIQKNEEISIQRDIEIKQRKRLEEQHKKITASIRYAQQIQSLIIPSADSFGKFFKNFLLYLPKDIIGGDFFWFRKIDNYLLVAVADCTGHGVPGALVTMLGVTYLNEITSAGTTEPDKILNKLRLLVKKAFTEEVENKNYFDGMDISLVKIDLLTLKISFSGANNPLYIVRKGGVELENNAILRVFNHKDYNLIELKADRMPIGRYRLERNFITKEFHGKEQDMLYLFSDGYKDQLGGNRGNEQIKTIDFKRILCEISQNPTEEQQNILHKRLLEWQGNNAQTDDILVFGFRLIPNRYQIY